MDNRYACPDLAIILRDQCTIFSKGMVIINGMVFLRDVFTLAKSSAKGEYKVAYDRVNKLVYLKWRDSKVAYFVLTIKDTHISSCFRCQGANIIQLECPNVLHRYHNNMYGVDKGDQIRMKGGVF